MRQSLCGAALLLVLAGSARAAQLDYDAHVAALQKKIEEKLPDQRFTIVVEKPFVVIGDERPRRVRERAESTVRWAVALLRKSYFKKDPAAIIDIWLFQDEDSYKRNAKTLFGEEPDTPYGYFSHEQRAMVMNISTGGGTLVHEIVHAFMPANFPRCPSWFNEGLASLYEQCDERDGKIVGRTNWRLSGLQKAIHEEKVEPFDKLCKTTTKEFYESARGSNYAQARYLCYYLQEEGLLEKFYHRFRLRCEKDPSGYETLQDVLGRPDMDKFFRTWKDYVLELRFR